MVNPPPKKKIALGILHFILEIRYFLGNLISLKKLSQILIFQIPKFLNI